MKIQTIRERLLTSSMIGGIAIVAAAAVPALTVVMLPTAATAQSLTQGALSGTVLNQANQPVPGATVTLRSNAQGFQRTVTTGASGEFRLPALPQGSYEISISASNYNALTDSVTVGGDGTTSVTLVVGAVDAATVDEIVVVGVRQAVSAFDATTTGLSVNVEELAARTPIARSASAVALLAPGVVAGDSAFGDTISIGGSSAGENTYFVNGLNITKFRDFTGSSTIPFEFLRTVETKTGGYSAEFGRGTGGVLNQTTKSGGNEWKFGVTSYWESNDLRSNSPDTYLATNSLDERESSDVVIEAGGPIIPNRLFAYGIYDFRDRSGADTSATNGRRTEYENDSPFYGGKVDFLVTDDHRIEATYWTDEIEQTAETFLADGTSIGQSLTEQGGENYIVRYTGVWTDWLTTSLAYGVNEYNEYSGSPNDNCPLVQNIIGGAATNEGCWLVSQPSVNEDSREILRFDVDLYANLFGEHHFRFGVDNEKLESRQTLDYTGTGFDYSRPGACFNDELNICSTGQVTDGIYYRYQNLGSTNPAALPTVRIQAYANNGEFTSEQNAYYIQDSWEVTDQLTLNLGLRYESFTNANAAGENFLELKDQLSPRLGFTYDVLGDRTSKLFGFYGRYYLPVATNTNMRLAGQEFFIRDFWTLNTSGVAGDANADGRYDADLSPVLLNLISTQNLADGDVATTAAAVDQNIDPMYVDEFILGYEQQLPWSGWSAGLTVQYRELGTAIDDVAIDAAVLAYCADEGIAGCGDVWTGFHQYVLTNPGEDMVITLNGSDLAQTSVGAGATDRVVNLTAADLNYPTPDRTYIGAEVMVEKDFDGIWGARFSYLWSENKGNYEGALKSDNGQTDPGLSQDFDQPGLVDGAYGFLPNHREHQFKAFGSWQATRDLIVGANVLIASPRKFGCQGLHPTDEFAQAYGAASWFCDLNGDGVQESTPRGSQFESNWLKQVDLTFAYNVPFSFGRFGEGVTLRADIFNVFNFESAIDYNEFGEIDTDGTAAGAVPDPTYHRITGYQAPRYVRLSAAVKF
ncbi:MAG: TonB-dependent receptor domain-containing protein [Brevundimonas sp.]